MVSWFKHDIRAWREGTQPLPDDLYRVYHIIILMIYYNDGPIPRHERGIAGACNQDIRRTKRCLSELLEMGKIYLTKEGKIGNGRADVELTSVLGKGYVGRVSPRKSLKSNGSDRQIEIEIEIEKKKGTAYPKKKISPPSKGSSICNDNWTPKTTTTDALKAEGRTQPQLQSSLASMIDWSRGGGKLRHDWDAVFRNWVRRDHGRGTGYDTPDPRDWKKRKRDAAIAETRKDLACHPTTQASRRSPLNSSPEPSPPTTIVNFRPKAT